MNLYSGGSDILESLGSNIGVNKLREISNEDNCPFVLWIGNKRRIKRKLLDAYIERAYSL